MKRILKCFFIGISILLLTFLFSLSNTEIVLAKQLEDHEKDGQQIEYNSPSDPMYGSTSGLYADEDVYYTLDIVSPTEIEDQGFFSDIWDTITLKKVKDGFADAFHFALFYVAQIAFQFNLFMTNVMLGILNFSYDVNIINSLIDSIENTITGMTGISGTSFGSSGLFGGFLGIISLIVAIYTLYQFVVKKASITAFGALLKTVIALTVALLFFNNYSSIIKGANTISVEASGMILSGSANTEVSDNGNINNITVKEKMNDNIFNTFVHKPYLMLQYGTTDQSEIGDDRVLSLLSEPSGEARQEIANQEVTEHGNDTLLYESLIQRLIFSNVMILTNTVSSIPIYLLSFTLIIFQFWFLVIAMIAPFALLWSALPNQFGVLKRYFLELLVPLVLKMGVSVLALVIFGLSEVVYGISSLSNGSTLGFILSTIVQAIILLTLFLLRKRIFNIFSMGSQELNAFRNEMNNSFVQPVKNGVQTVATTAGTVAGAVAGGPQGAMIGASVGGTVGNLATGDMGVGDGARNLGMSYYMADRMNANKDQENNSNDNPNPTNDENSYLDQRNDQSPSIDENDTEQNNYPYHTLENPEDDGNNASANSMDQDTDDGISNLADEDRPSLENEANSFKMDREQIKENVTSSSNISSPEINDEDIQTPNMDSPDMEGENKSPSNTNQQSVKGEQKTLDKNKEKEMENKEPETPKKTLGDTNKISEEESQGTQISDYKLADQNINNANYVEETRKKKYTLDVGINHDVEQEQINLGNTNE